MNYVFYTFHLQYMRGRILYGIFFSNKLCSFWYNFYEDPVETHFKHTFTAFSY